jgi:carboxymethylenebutenolidase
MDWTRAIADQLAKEGYVAMAPDTLSGFGPGGGGQDSFEFPDDIVKAMGRLSDEESMRRLRAAREYGLKLPRVSGKTAAIGFCWGGSRAFQLAAQVPELAAAIVYYGTAPEPAEMAKIQAPVIGFYGELDPRIVSTVAPTAAEMKRLGKSYESHIYKDATHAFLYIPGLGDNDKAAEDAWPKTIAFLKQHLK